MNQDDYSSSNRRKFLIGAGSVAVGGSALLGTAATTTFNLNDRAVSANVVTDSDGAVALTDDEQGDIINYTNDELEIDFSEGGATGVNVGSVVEIGDGLDPSADPAFTITNQTTDAVDLVFEFVAGNNYSVNTSGSELTFYLKDDSQPASETLTVNETSVPVGGDAASVDFSGSNELKDGQNLDVAIKVDADNSGSTVGEDLSGVLNITATQSESA